MSFAVNARFDSLAEHEINRSDQTGVREQHTSDDLATDRSAFQNGSHLKSKTRSAIQVEAMSMMAAEPNCRMNRL